MSKSKNNSKGGKDNDRDDDRGGSHGNGNGNGNGHDSHGNGHGYGHHHGSSGNDFLVGSKGNDEIHGGRGHDFIFGGKGHDTLDGGSGWDWVLGGGGNDVLGYRMAENIGARDWYHGGTGNDTLRLELTEAEWARADVKADVARFIAWLEDEQGDTDDDDCFDLDGFEFRTFNLNVWDVENLVLRVNGVVVDPGGDPDPVVTVDAVNDSAAVGQDGTVSGNVLANDTVTGAAIQSVQLVTGPGYGSSVSLAADGSYAYTAGAGLDALAQGETGTDSFTYGVTAVGGTTDNATVTVTVTGVNDAPVANADVAGGLENQIITLNLLANDTDVDNGAVLSMVAASTAAGQGSVSVTGNTVLFNPGTDFDYLGAGDEATLVVSYAMRDELGALSSSTATITVLGENDAPVAEPSRTALVLTPGATPLGIETPADAEGDVLGATITQALGIGVLRDGEGNVVTLGSSLSIEQLESLAYTPASGANGTIGLVSYSLADGNGGTTTSTVIIFVVAGAPVIPGVTATGTLETDTFDFNAPGAPAVISGFASGDNGDVLDVSDLLTGYTPGSSNASQFVSLVGAAGNTLVLVNADGVGADFMPVATLLGEAGLSVSEMLAEGNLFLG